jgi:hypothetical protein
VPSYQAESRIIHAAHGVVKGDTSGLVLQFPVIRLTESLMQLVAFGVGTLAIAGFPVRPKDFPSQREIVYADVYFCPVLVKDATNFDSPLAATELFNQFRKLLFSNLPLADTNGVVCDAVLDFDWRRTVLPQGVKGNTRIPIFVARYQTSIDLTTGAPA